MFSTTPSDAVCSAMNWYVVPSSERLRSRRALSTCARHLTMARKDAARYGGNVVTSSLPFLPPSSGGASVGPSLEHDATLRFTLSRKTSNISCSRVDMTDERLASSASDWSFVR